MRRRTGFYWVKLSPVISDGWEVAHWSEVIRTWQIHGRTNDYDETFIVEVDEVRLTHPRYED
jgi:hypothetical protein